MGAAYGLKPADVYGMSPRELELWIDGCTDRQCDLIELVMGLVVAPLMNVHTKRRVRPAQLVPKSVANRDRPGRRRRAPLDELPGQDIRELARARMREIAAERAARFWEGREGRALAELLKAT